jgi:hypothetical protein
LWQNELLISKHVTFEFPTAVLLRIQVSLEVMLHNWVSKGKVKCTLVQALRLCTGHMAHRGSRGIALPFHDHGTRRAWEVSVRPWPLFIPGKTQYPLCRSLGGPQGWSGQLQEISPPPGFYPRTIQPVTSHYTNYATRPTIGWVVQDISKDHSASLWSSSPMLMMRALFTFKSLGTNHPTTQLHQTRIESSINMYLVHNTT